MAGDAMGDVIGDIGAVIFLTVRRALLSAPGGAPRPSPASRSSYGAHGHRFECMQSEGLYETQPWLEVVFQKPEPEELEVRMILKARSSMRWPDRCEI